MFQILFWREALQGLFRGVNHGHGQPEPVLILFSCP